MEENTSCHIAVIPDGNRRWARKKGLPLWIGHQVGAKNLEKILKKALELKIPYFTFWGASWDNLTKRPKTEVKFLFKIYTDYFKRALKSKEIHQNKVKISVLGRWKEILPKETQEVIEMVQDSTGNYNSYFLTFLLAYNGTDEIIDCIQKIANSAKGKTIKITEKLIKENLWTKDLPPVDLIIRTGCESDPHLSAGFMIWNTSYSQLCFTKTFFPTFSPKEFEKIIRDYSQRERRRGV